MSLCMVLWLSRFSVQLEKGARPMKVWKYGDDVISGGEFRYDATVACVDRYLTMNDVGPHSQAVFDDSSRGLITA